MYFLQEECQFEMAFFLPMWDVYEGTLSGQGDIARGRAILFVNGRGEINSSSQTLWGWKWPPLRNATKNKLPRGSSFLLRFLNDMDQKTIQSIITDIGNATKNRQVRKSRTFEIITLDMQEKTNAKLRDLARSRPDQNSTQDLRG